jgi:hypothetical protein
VRRITFLENDVTWEFQKGKKPGYFICDLAVSLIIAFKIAVRRRYNENPFG